MGQYSARVRGQLALIALRKPETRNHDVENNHSRIWNLRPSCDRR